MSDAGRAFPGPMGAAPGDLSERSIVRGITVPASADRVWDLWTTEEGMTSWLVSSCRIELAVGGPFELHFMTDAPAGQQGSEGCRILSFLPHRMLSFTWNAPPHFPAIRGQHTWVVVELSEAEDGTRVRLTHLGWPGSGWSDGSAWPEVFAYFERAWTNVVKELAECCAKGS